jgi:hypothetical protein
MNSRPTQEHIDSAVAHVISTLPDSFRLRKTVLVTLLHWLPRDYAGRLEIEKLLEAQRLHESAQLKFRELVS